MRKKLFVLWTFVLSTCSPVLASFQDSGWGARPVGMGGAFTAVSDDANAPLFNPAGLVQVQWHEISAAYSRLFSGLTLYSGDDQVHLDQSYLAYVSKPLSRIGSVGLSWASFNTTHLYREDTVSLSYARYLGDFFPALDKKFSLGLNLKYLRRSITLDARTTNDPVFSDGNSKSGIGVDAGFLYKPDDGMLEGFRLGFSAQNLNQPDLGFDERDRVPTQWRLGVAYQSQKLHWLVPALDLTRRNGVLGVHSGVESWLFHDALGLRAGINRDEGAAGLSYYQPVGKSFGFRIDYGFTIPFFVEGTSGSHRVGATVFF